MKKPKLRLSTIYRKAARLVRKGWATGGWAKDAKGKTVPFYAAKAKCFCAMGALCRVGEASEDSCDGGTTNDEDRLGRPLVEHLVRVGEIKEADDDGKVLGPTETDVEFAGYWNDRSNAAHVASTLELVAVQLKEAGR
jgi:hypothetical protein